MRSCILQKRALITGITGQDGSYLGELLLERSVLGWTHKTRFEQLVHEMLVHDCRALGAGEEALKAAA